MLKRACEKETREGRGSVGTEGPRKSFPAPNLITWQPLRDLSEVLTENDWPRTNKGCRLFSFVTHSFLPHGEKWMRDKRTPKDVCGEAGHQKAFYILSSV